MKQELTQGWHLPLYCTESLPAVALIMVAVTYFASFPAPDFSLCGGELCLLHLQNNFLFPVLHLGPIPEKGPSEVSQLYCSVPS